MSTDNTATSKPNPILMVGEGTLNLLKQAAFTGKVFADGTYFSSMALLANYVKKSGTDVKMALDFKGGPVGTAMTAVEAWLDVTGALSDNRICTVVIINTLDSSVNLSKNTYAAGLHTGFQAYHPAKATFTADGKRVTYDEPNIIPGKTVVGAEAAVYGVGIYRFEKSSNALMIGVHGTGGALQFSAPDADLSDDINIAFEVGFSSDNIVSVSKNPRNFDNLDDFYTKKIQGGGGQGGSDTGKANIIATIMPYDVDSADPHAHHNGVATILISKQDYSKRLKSPVGPKAREVLKQINQAGNTVIMPPTPEKIGKNIWSKVTFGIFD